MKINFVVLAIVLSVMVFVSSVSAGPPKPNVFDGGNKWKITNYKDSTSTHNRMATQEICFLPYTVVGSSIQGRWYSTSYPNWNGRYYQEGDEVKMTGDFWNDGGHDHMTLVHTTCDAAGNVFRGMAFGDWTEWLEDGRYGKIICWANAKLERIGYSRFPRIFDRIPVLTPKAPERLVLHPKPLERLVMPPKDLEKFVLPPKDLEKFVLPPKDLEKFVLPPKDLENFVLAPKDLENFVLAPKDLEKLEYEMLDMSSFLPQRLTVNGDIASSPAQDDLESLDDYKLRTGVE